MEFVDTNILLYAVSTANDERAKSEKARSVLARKELALSVQVLQEFYVQATRTDKPDALSHEQTVRLIDALLRFSVQEITVSLMHAAFKTRDRFQISYWDAAIIEAARFAGCNIVSASSFLARTDRAFSDLVPNGNHPNLVRLHPVEEAIRTHDNLPMRQLRKFRYAATRFGMRFQTA